MVWHEHGSDGSTCANTGLSELSSDCELRKGQYGRERMTDEQIIKRRRASKGGYFIYTCHNCTDFYAHTPVPMQLLRYNLREMKGDCPNCGIIDLKRGLGGHGRNNWLAFKNWNHSQLYHAGEPAQFKTIPGKHKRYEPSIAPEPSKDPPRYTMFGGDEDDYYKCGDGCGCPKDTTGRKTRWNNWGGVLYDIGVVEGLNLTGPTYPGEIVNRCGAGGQPLDVVYIHRQGWVQTKIVRRPPMGDDLSYWHGMNKGDSNTLPPLFEE